MKIPAFRALASSVVAVSLSVAAAGAQAALIDRGGGMIYDTTRNITWLADLNYAFTSGYAAANLNLSGASDQVRANGTMGWDGAMTWASQLVYGGYDDWRLPTERVETDATCVEVTTGVQACSGGEMTGLLYNDLGVKPGETIQNTTGDTAEQIANAALFNNVPQFEEWWSGSERSPISAWLVSIGYIVGMGKSSVVASAWAVRDGDVAQASVPEPQTLAMVLLALASAGLAAPGRRARGR